MQPDVQHEIQGNDLAESTLAVVDRIRPHLRTIGLLAILVLVSLAAWNLIMEQQTALKAASWDALNGSANLDELADVQRRFPNSDAARWSGLLQGGAALEEGVTRMFTAPQSAKMKLEEAAGFYVGLLADKPRGMVAERAIFGLAKARECLGQFDEALQGYETLVKEHPDSPFREQAENRIAALGRPQTREWYAWFAEQTPGAADLDMQPAAPETTPDPAAAAPAPNGEPAAPAAAPPSEPAAPAEPTTEPAAPPSV